MEGQQLKDPMNKVSLIKGIQAATTLNTRQQHIFNLLSKYTNVFKFDCIFLSVS